MVVKDKSDKIDFSQTSYLLGIVSIVMAFFTPLLGLAFGIIGLVQSAKQKTKISKLSKKLNIIDHALTFIINMVGWPYFLYHGIRVYLEALEGEK